MPFHRSEFTAAHKSLPFGTRLNVCTPTKCVEVVVTDRGPFVAGRDLDLSEAAAAALGIKGKGVSEVWVTLAGN